MSKISLTLSLDGIESAQSALTRKRLSQRELAKILELSPKTVNNFFTGKVVKRKIFVEICEELELDWEKVSVSIDIDILVQQVREKIKPYIQECCGTMRVLDMTQPISLGDIYTNVNILEEIKGRRRIEVADLLKNFDPEKLDRFGLSGITEERMSGLQAVQRYSKLIVFGKPGAGKTTFLKYLAIQCIEEQFDNDRFPILISLKDFAEAPKQPNILEYIAQQLSKYELTDANVKAEQLLKQGKVLILLDGLDEVREEDTKKVLKQIQNFSYQFHNNQFVTTCRIAAKEYTFQGFTEVEIADFDKYQIATFAQNWFRLSDSVKGERFIEKLKENKPIQELATNPLLLTLLCLFFDEAENLPASRFELYTESIDLLLKKWDAKRNIERDQVYKNLSLQRKENLLSQIALITFEQNNYFFKQKTVKGYIANFISDLREAYTDLKELELDSEAVLKSIEVQHGLLVERAKGIFSFSHITFHEYFAAKKIATISDLEELKNALQNIASHITEKRWREIFLLASEMLTSPDYLLRLMKQQVDALLVTNEKLLQFHSWVDKKSRSIKAPYKLATIRAFYSNMVHDLDHELVYKLAYNYNPNFTLTVALIHTLAYDPKRDLNRDLNRAIAFARCLNLNNDSNRGLASVSDLNSNQNMDTFIRAIDFDLALDLVLVRVFDIATDITRNITSHYVSDLDITNNYASNLNYVLEHKLVQLKNKLPNLERDSEEYEQWWHKNGQAWTKQLRAAMIQHRNISLNWQFNDSEEEVLKQYYDANKLLADCLNSSCNISQEVRQKIEDTLLLPLLE